MEYASRLSGDTGAGEARLPMLTASDRSTGWLDQAACRHCDPELFFPDSDVRPVRAQVEAAKKVCRGCPVRGTCLRWALDHGQEAGIWGGTTEQERRQLRRHRSALLSPAYGQGIPPSGGRKAPRDHDTRHVT
jgi:WhiB family redox-sensing transcriptional regulator